jgi:hypothetical protein
MINFRFHIVSIIAIFLALALGVVIGAGVIDRGVVDALDNRLDTVEARSERIRQQNDELTGRNDQLSDWVKDVQPFAVDGRLPGDDIGIVAVRGIDGDQVAALGTALQQADARVSGTLWLEDKWALDSEDDVQALQDALGSTTKNKTTLRAEGYKQLATRLATPGVAGERDLLSDLEQAGFLGFDANNGSTLAQFPGIGAGVVLAVGNQGAVAPDLVAMPAAKALHAADVETVVAGVWADTGNNAPDRTDAVDPVREGDLKDSVSTVDDLDLPEGPTTVTLALSDLFLLPPVVGHYGYGDNASQPLPSLVSG